MTPTPTSRAYLLYGADDFSVTRALSELKATLGPAEELMANTATLDGKELSFAQLKMICDTIPFLAGHRLVIVQGLFERFERRERGPMTAPPKGFAEWEHVGGYTGMMPETTTLIFISGALSPGNPLLRAVQGRITVRAFSTLKGFELHKWIEQHVVDAGGQIEPAAVRLLAEFVSGDLRLIDSEVKKLVLFANGRTVRESDVRALVHSTHEAIIFELTDALVLGQPQAMRVLKELLEQGEPAPMIITMLSRQLRLMLQAKSALDAGVEVEELGEILGTTSDFVVRKTRDQVRSYSLEALKAFYIRLLETDLAIKSGELKDELALELFVAESARR